MKKPTVDIITMGCSKNLVDSERLMGLFEANGYSCTHDSEQPTGDIAVVNTCGFIADAKEESINMILELAQQKTEGRLKRLYVMGCLSERYLADLQQEIPEVDGWYGKFNYQQLLADLSQENVCNGKRHITTPRHYAYIKISEGCDRHCAYCAIPLITGPHQSRPIDDILDEVRELVADGTKEFQIIAQELTYYGVDLYGHQAIAELVDRMADINGVEWIRLHYAYPAHFPWELLEVMRRRKNVCRYLDIALQHISDHMLDRMHRNVTKEQTMELIRRLREEVPGLHIRTTLMVGFPGESDEDFRELLDFVKWARFECMGAFAYSEEEGTYSGEHYADDVAEEVKQQRLSRLMRVQQNISAELMAKEVGQTLKVIIDRREGDYYVGRTEFASPEVDPEVLIEAADGTLETGRFYDVEITDAEEFDLYGRVVDEGATHRKQ